jgi:hypothetical protein
MSIQNQTYVKSTPYITKEETNRKNLAKIRQEVSDEFQS